jgi:hyperosmotically inducible periplasmic protein
MKRSRLGLSLLLAFSVLPLGLPTFVSASLYAYAQSGNGQSDNNIRAAVLNAIKKSEFKGVQVSVQNGVVDLEGTVKDFATKEELDKRVHRIKGVAAVRNNVQVAGAGEVSDAELLKKIASAIQYDRVGYWGNTRAIPDVTPFNAIGVRVQNGVVTLSGHAYDPVSADSAVSIASRTPGVQDVIDDIQVDPLSPMDDRLRLQLFRAIYGFPSLNKYAIDPGKAIRIIVVNGHVTLYGQVDSQADKDTAGIRANSVPGVFGVTNDLQVAGQPSERK